MPYTRYSIQEFHRQSQAEMLAFRSQELRNRAGLDDQMICGRMTGQLLEIDCRHDNTMNSCTDWPGSLPIVRCAGAIDAHRHGVVSRVVIHPSGTWRAREDLYIDDARDDPAGYAGPLLHRSRHLHPTERIRVGITRWQQFRLSGVILHPPRASRRCPIPVLFVAYTVGTGSATLPRWTDVVRSHHLPFASLEATCQRRMAALGAAVPSIPADCGIWQEPRSHLFPC